MRGARVHLPQYAPHVVAAAPPTPLQRGDCIDGPRPCPHLRCTMNLGLPGVRLGWSCALDVADAGETSLADVGELVGLTRERVRQIEASRARAAAPARPVIRALGRELGDSWFERETGKSGSVKRTHGEPCGLDDLEVKEKKSGVIG
jgi:hypothetical protein